MWQPIPLRELNVLKTEQLAECSSDARAQYEANSLLLKNSRFHLGGDVGGGFWVVAVFDNTALWYNDIEEGFNTSSYTTKGVIEQYWCNQDRLQISLNRLGGEIEKLAAPVASCK